MVVCGLMNGWFSSMGDESALVKRGLPNHGIPVMG